MASDPAAAGAASGGAVPRKERVAAAAGTSPTTSPGHAHCQRADPLTRRPRAMTGCSFRASGAPARMGERNARAPPQHNTTSTAAAAAVPLDPPGPPAAAPRRTKATGARAAARSGERLCSGAARWGRPPLLAQARGALGSAERVQRALRRGKTTTATTTTAAAGQQGAMKERAAHGWLLLGAVLAAVSCLAAAPPGERDEAVNKTLAHPLEVARTDAVQCQVPIRGGMIDLRPLRKSSGDYEMANSLSPNFSFRLNVCG